MTAVATQRKQYTLLEYLELAYEVELAGSWDCFEIMGGELVAHATPDDPHMRAAVACFLYLGDAQRAGYGRAGIDRTVALDYQAPDIPVREAYKPDAFFVMNGGVAILNHPEVPSVVGAPDVVAEVLSPTTATNDRPPRGRKCRGYEQAGARHYWLVDTVGRSMTTFEHRDERLVQTAILRAGEMVRCPLFPGLSLAADTVFGALSGK